MDRDDIWSYAPGSAHRTGEVLTGFTVEATDGTIGHVDRQAEGTPMRHLIVDTGVWVFGRSLLVPAGLVSHIDTEARKVTLARTRDEIKSAPAFRTDRETLDAAYLDSVADYYLGLPPGQAM